MSIFLCIAIFGLGVLIGQAIEERKNRKANTITTAEFCEQVARKIVKHMREGQ